MANLDLDDLISEAIDEIFLAIAMARMELYLPKSPSHGHPPEYITDEPWEEPSPSDFESTREYSSRCLVNLNPVNATEVNTGLCWWPVARSKGNTNLRAILHYQTRLLDDAYQSEFPNTVAFYKKLTARRLLRIMYSCWLQPDPELLDLAEFEKGTPLNALTN